MSLNSLRTRNLLTTDVITTSPDTAIAEVFELLLRHDSHCVLIADETKRLLGIVTDRDILSVLMVNEPLTSGLLTVVLQTRETILEYLRQRIKSRSETAAGIMATPVVTVTSEDGLDKIVALMALNDSQSPPLFRSREE